jgi:hypothetical protein
LSSHRHRRPTSRASHTTRAAKHSEPRPSPFPSSCPRPVLTAPSPACRAASAPLINSPPYFILKFSSPAIAASATESKRTRHKPRSGTAPRNARDVPRTPHTFPRMVGPSSSASASRRARYTYSRCSRFPRAMRTCSRRRRPRAWGPRSHREERWPTADEKM